MNLDHSVGFEDLSDFEQLVVADFEANWLGDYFAIAVVVLVG